MNENEQFDLIYEYNKFGNELNFFIPSKANVLLQPANQNEITSKYNLNTGYVLIAKEDINDEGEKYLYVVRNLYDNTNINSTDYFILSALLYFKKISASKNEMTIELFTLLKFLFGEQYLKKRSGRYKELLKHSLTKIKSIDIYTRNIIPNNNKNDKSKYYTMTSFTILDYVLMTQTYLTIKFNEIYLKSIASQYNSVVLDIFFMKELKKSYSILLYRYLQSLNSATNQYVFEFDVVELITELNPLYNSTRKDNIIRNLKPSLLELQEKGFIKNFHYSRGNLHIELDSNKPIEDEYGLYYKILPKTFLLDNLVTLGTTNIHVFEQFFKKYGIQLLSKLYQQAYAIVYYNLNIANKKYSKVFDPNKWLENSGIKIDALTNKKIGALIYNAFKNNATVINIPEHIIEYFKQHKDSIYLKI